MTFQPTWSRRQVNFVLDYIDEHAASWAADEDWQDHPKRDFPIIVKLLQERFPLDPVLSETQLRNKLADLSRKTKVKPGCNSGLYEVLLKGRAILNPPFGPASAVKLRLKRALPMTPPDIDQTSKYLSKTAIGDPFIYLLPTHRLFILQRRSSNNLPA